MEEVKLLRFWYSPFSFRVELALKLKGVNYELVEEDYFKKSALLLQSNPIHKKIPVLIHQGKPIAESMIIVEYIDETWPKNPLLPIDPYERSVARFWTKFFEDKSASLWACCQTTGEEQQKAIKETLEMLKTIEDHAGLGEKKFFGGNEIGFADVAFVAIAHWLGVIEDYIEVKLVEAHSFPHLSSWIKRFKEVPAIKEILPKHNDLLAFFKQMNEKMSSSSSST